MKYYFVCLNYHIKFNLNILLLRLVLSMILTITNLLILNCKMFNLPFLPLVSRVLSKFPSNPIFVIFSVYKFKFSPSESVCSIVFCGGGGLQLFLRVVTL